MEYKILNSLNSNEYATQTSLLVSLAKENPDEFLLRV